MPCTENLLSLARALPPPEVQSAEQKALVESLIKDFPSIAVSPRQESQGSASVHIPAVIYAQNIDTLVSKSPGQTLWSASDGIMQLALRQLDPNEVGIAITIATCMPPSGAHIVRSLHHYAGRGTSPWKIYLDLEPPFLGRNRWQATRLRQDTLLNYCIAKTTRAYLLTGHLCKSHHSNGGICLIILVSKQS